MLHFSSLSGGRARRTSGAVLLVLLVSIAPLGAATPPWAVESPAAAGHGARFGLGVDYLFEHQESLRIGSQQSVTSLPTEDGGIRTMVVDGDAELLNRKFDLEWELKGPGVQVPLALSCFRLTDLIRVFPTLTLEAATVDVTLGSISKTELNPKVSLQGRGPMFGAKLGATASLCDSCTWFMGTSYHYRSLPAFKADRSPAFVEPGFEVLHDEVRLSQEVHEVSTKFGYIAPNKRVAYYTGVRGRWTDVEIEDELRLANVDIRQEMGLSSRTKLKSETIEAVAGVDAHLGGSIFGSTEATYGDQDYGVLVKLIYVPLWESSETINVERQEKIERYSAIAGLLIPQLARVLEQFRAGWKALTVVEGPAYPAAEVDALLLKSEADLINVFNQHQDLEPLRDWVRDRFREARSDLGLAPAKVASLSFQVTQTRRALSKARTDENVDGIIKPLQKIVRDGKFWTKFIFRASLASGHQIDVHPVYKRGEPESIVTLSPGEEEELVYGDYSFEIYRMEEGERRSFRLCDALTKDKRGSPCPLLFMGRPRFVLRCDPTGCTSRKWGDLK